MPPKCQRRDAKDALEHAGEVSGVVITEPCPDLLDREGRKQELPPRLKRDAPLDHRQGRCAEHLPADPAEVGLADAERVGIVGNAAGFAEFLIDEEAEGPDMQTSAPFACTR